MRMIHEDSSSFNVEWKSGRFSHAAKAISGNVNMSQNGPIVNAFDPLGGTRQVRLPPFEPGRFYVVSNVGDSGTLEVISYAGAPVATLDAGASTLLFASDDVWTGVAGSFTDVFGPAGPGHSTGLVPDPGPGPVDPDLADRRYLSETGEWTTVTGLAASNSYFKDMRGGGVTLTPTGAEILEFLSANTAISILAQSGTSPKSMRFTFNVGNVDHNALLNYSADRHIAHSGVTLTAGLGISGGGDITASRTFDFAPSELTANSTPVLADYAIVELNAGGPRRTRWSFVNGILDHNALLNYVATQHVDHAGVSIVASTGLSGGGDLTTSRSIALNITGLTADIPATLDEIPFFDVSGGDTNKVTIAGLNSVLDHNALLNVSADQHVAHSGVNIATTEGIQGGGTIAASRTLKLDINGLAGVTPSAADYVAVYQASSGLHKKVAISDWPGGGIGDAPSDGELYARRDATWAQIPTITVSSTAPPSPEAGDVWIDTT